MAKWIVLLVMVAMCFQPSLSRKENFLTGILGNDYENIFAYACKDEEECHMEAAESYGCHLYSTSHSRDPKQCLVKTYTKTTPTVYIKPDEDFEHFEVTIYNSLCILEVGKWKLTSKMFSEKNSWYKIKVHHNERHQKYHLFVNEEEVEGEVQHYYRSANKTHIQIISRGSSLWSFDCDPEDASFSSYNDGDALLPWAMFFVVSCLLVIFLIVFILYFLKKLKKQKHLNGTRSLQYSTRSTVSLISSPSLSYPGSSDDIRSSSNSCMQSWPQDPANASRSSVQGFSYLPAGNLRHDVQRYSVKPTGHPVHDSKKLAGIPGGNKPFQSYSSNPDGSASAEPIYEEHIYEEPDENIYHEIDAFGPPVFTDVSRQQHHQRLAAPYSRENSTGSSFSTANSLYGYI